NDGNEERVLKFEFYNNYMHSTQLMVKLDSPSQEADQKTMPSPDSWLFPCQFDPTVENAGDCPPFSNKNDGGELHMQAGKEATTFIGRYTLLSPCLFENKTFISVSSVSEDTLNYYAVVKLTQNRQYEKACLIRREIENF